MQDCFPRIQSLPVPAAGVPTGYRLVSTGGAPFRDRVWVLPKTRKAAISDSREVDRVGERSTHAHAFNRNDSEDKTHSGRHGSVSGIVLVIAICH
jgi:hypothetical protein